MGDDKRRGFSNAGWGGFSGVAGVALQRRVLFQQRGTTRKGFSNVRWVLPAGDGDNGKNK